MASYKNNVGRLVTDRFDFEKHINGTALNHDASHIVLDPPVVVNSVTKTNVQTAIEGLASYIVTSVADATTTTKGIVTLAGDISGTASSVLVTGLRGYPISNTIPSFGQLLCWDGSSWVPTTISVGFTAGGDLLGTSSSQTVISTTGNSNKFSVKCDNIEYLSTLSPTISQASRAAGNGASLSIYAQSTGGASMTGGFLNLSGGLPGSGGKAGGVRLQVSGGTFTLVEAAEVVVGNKVLALVGDTALTNVEMPASTGNGVIYIKDAITDPYIGFPTGGTILYSSSGKLKIRQTDGADFTIGDVPNPLLSGNSYSWQYVIKRSLAPEASEYGVYVEGTGYQLPATPCAAVVEVDAVGTYIDLVDPTDGYACAYKIMRSFTIKNGTTVSGVASQSLLFTQEEGGTWTPPSITSSGRNIFVECGNSSAATSYWYIVVKITVSVNNP